MKLLTFLFALILSFSCQTVQQEEPTANPLVPEPVISCDILAEMIAQDLANADYQYISSFQDEGGALVFLFYNYKKETLSVDVFTPPGYDVPDEHVLNEGRDCWSIDATDNKTYYWKHWYLRDRN